MIKNNIIYIVFILSSLKAFSQTVGVLSYETYLKNVLENNPVSKKAQNLKEYGELQYKAAKGNFDPAISGTYDNKFYNNSNYYSVLSSAVKIPLYTAQNLKVGYEYGAGANINPEKYTPSYGLPYVGLEVGLLQGLVIDYRRAEVMKSKEYMDYYTAEKNVQLNSLLFESSLKYFDWLFSLKQVDLNNYFLNIARQRLIGIEALAVVGERASIDTIEAAIFYQSRMLELQNVKIDNQKHSNDLASYNWQSGGSALSYQFIPQDSLDEYFEKVKNNFITKIYQDSSSNPIITKYNSLQNVLAIDNKMKKEMIKPKLNVNYNFLSYNANSYSPVYSQNNYKWGVDLSFPLLFRKSINEYKMSKLNYQNTTLELANKNNEIDLKINALNQNMSLLAEQLQVAERSVKYCKQLVDAEKLKFVNGESSLFVLNARENKWLESELKLSEYKLKFIKTVLNIIYLKGNLNYYL